MYLFKHVTINYIMNSLVTKILTDSIPDNLRERSIIYCFAHHPSNIPQLVEAVRRIHLHVPVYILGNQDCMSGVLTYNKNKHIYRENGIEVNEIPYTLDIINTKTESNCVTLFCKQQQIKNVILVAPSFHIVRATMTFITSYMDISQNEYRQDNKDTMKIYSLSNAKRNWNECVISHQGKTNCSYFEMVELEYDRITRYTKKGDIKPYQEILNYYS